MSTPVKSVSVDWKKWEWLHRRPSLWTRLKLFFAPATITMDRSGNGGQDSDYTVKQYWKEVDGRNYLIGEEVLK